MNEPSREERIQALLAEAPFLSRLAQSLCGATERDELVQETWLIALTQPPKKMSSPRGWLTATFRGQRAKWYRRESRLRNREQASARDESVSGNEHELERLEVHSHLLDGVRALPAKYRDVVWYKFYDQLSHTDIAARLQLEESTVRTRLARGLEKLRDILDIKTPGGRERWMSAVLPIGIASAPLQRGVGAILVMKKLMIAIGILAACFWGISRYASWERPAQLVEPVGGDSQLALVVDPVSTVSASTLEGGEDTSSLRIPSPSTTTSRSVAGEIQTCQITGRVVDQGDGPLSGVRVVLWGKGHWPNASQRKVTIGIDRVMGWECTTGMDGTFAFEVSVPSAKFPTLRIEPHALLESKTVRFWGKSNRATPALVQGQRDLGLFRLLPAGCASGSVRDERGNPIAGALVEMLNDSVQNLSSRTITDSRGRFSVGHIPPGTHGIELSSDRFLTGVLESVSILPSRETSELDFVLGDSPTISGSVIDAQGIPLAGVSLTSWPMEDGACVSAKTGSDGRFTIYLNQVCPFTIEANHVGYQPFDSGSLDREEGARYFAAGTSNLRVKLLTDPKMRFLVLDKVTDEPIEEFGLGISRDTGRKVRGASRKERRPAPPAERHAKGVVELGARPGMDQYIVAASGYAERSGEVKEDRNEPGQQTIRLSRGAYFQGVITRGGKPQVGATVVFTPVRFARGTGLFLEQAQGRPIQELRYDPNRALRAKTNALGEFVVVGVKRRSEYQLNVNEGAPWQARMLPVVHLGKEGKDLGEISLEESASVRAEVRVPMGMDPRGIEFFLDSNHDQALHRPDANGVFMIRNLGPGLHLLGLLDYSGGLVGGTVWEFTLESGEEKSLTLDVRDRATCEVSVQVPLGEVLPDGLLISLSPWNANGRPGSEEVELGELDTEGRCSGRVRAFGRAQVFIGGHYTSVRAIPGAEAILIPGGNLHLDLELDFGGMILELPKAFVLPKSGSLNVYSASLAYEIEIVEGVLKRNGGGVQSWPDGRLRIDLIPAGVHSLTVEVVDWGSEESEATRFKTQSSIVVEPKKRVVVQLAE